MVEPELIQIINKQIDAHFEEGIAMQQLHEKLKAFIDNLIQNDFQRLVTILYKVDVDEGRLKRILKEEEGEDAAAIIAKLIIERELQKIESRERFKK